MSGNKNVTSSVFADQNCYCSSYYCMIFVNILHHKSYIVLQGRVLLFKL